MIKKTWQAEASSSPGNINPVCGRCVCFRLQKVICSPYRYPSPSPQENVLVFALQPPPPLFHGMVIFLYFFCRFVIVVRSWHHGKSFKKLHSMMKVLHIWFPIIVAKDQTIFYVNKHQRCLRLMYQMYSDLMCPNREGGGATKSSLSSLFGD